MPARPRRSNLGNVTLGCHSHLPLRVPRRWETCTLDRPRHPHYHDKQASAGTRDDLGPARGALEGAGQEVTQGVGSLVVWVELARPGKGVLGLYGNVMSDVTVRQQSDPVAADRSTTGHADGRDALAALLT